MINSFDVEVAQDVGMASAVLYYNIRYWCLKNKANNDHFHDGLYWTYNSMKAFKKLFPYMSEREIRTALKKLEDNGYMKTGNFNKDGRDRTRWYADLRPNKNNNDVSKVTDCICQNDSLHLSECTDASDELVEPLPNINQQITTTNNKKERKKESSDSARAKEKTFDEILDSVPVIKENEELRSAFLEFIKMRKLIKAPLTNRALELAINDAFKYGHGDPIQMTACVNQSVSRAWRGIFPITDSTIEPKLSRQQSVNPYTEMLKEEGYYD